MGIGESMISAGATAVVKALVERLFAAGGAKPGVAPSGTWHFSWTVEEPKDYVPRTIDDLVTVKVDKHGNVRGSGENPFYGPYTVTGTDTPFALTLTYRGRLGKSSNLPGICLIPKSPDPSELHGAWWQYEAKHTVIGGTLTMKRQA